MTRKANRYDAAWGLEFGGSAIRLVRVTRSGGGYRADAYREAALDGSQDRADALAEAVRRLGAPAIEPPLAVCMGDELTILRAMDLPGVATALEKMVLRQVEVLLGGQEELFAVGWAHYPHPAQAGQEHVMLCAARKDALSRLSRAAQALGCSPSAVMPSAIALAGGWGRLNEGASGLLALLDVGAKSTALVWLLDGRPFAGGLIDQGGDYWTAQIARELGMDAPKAEALKIRLMDPAAAGGAPATPDPGSEAAARGAIESALAQWAQQLSEAHQQCRQSLPGGRGPERCLIFGRAAWTDKLVELVGRTLGLEAQLAAPPARLALGEGVHFASAAAAIGAALCQLEPEPPACQLQSASVAAPRPAVPRSARRWALALAWLLAGVLVLYALDALDAHRLDGAVARIHAAIGGGQDVERQLAVGRYLDQAGAPPLAVLDEISSLAPAQAILNSWRYSRAGEVAVAGTVPAEQDLHAFMMKLSESTMFRDVALLSAKSESGRCRFEMSLRLAGAARASASQPASRPSSQGGAPGPATRGAEGPPAQPDSPAPAGPPSQPSPRIGGAL